MKSCEICGSYIPSNKYRPDAKYCSTNCRQKAYRQRNSSGKAAGRPRQHETNADRQRAYRQRKAEE